MDERRIAEAPLPAPTSWRQIQNAAPTETQVLAHGNPGRELQLRILELELQNQHLRQLHAELAAARNHYASLFELNPTPLFTLAADATVLEANEAAGGLLSCTRPALRGRRLAEFIAPEHAEAFARVSQRVLAEKSKGVHVRPICRVEIRSCAGTRLPARLEAVAMASTQNPTAALRVALQDLSEVEETRSTLHNCRAYLEGVVETPGEALLTVDSDGRVEVCNTAARRLFGLPSPTTPALSVVDLLAWPNAQAPVSGRELLQRLPAGGTELHGTRADGSNFPAHVDVSHVPLDGGTVHCLVVRDLTETKSLRAQLLQAQKLETVGALATGIAHDFNNLLMGIMGCAHIARDRLRDKDCAANYLDEIQHAAKRGADLTRRLLNFSRHRRPTPEPIELDRAIRSSYAFLSHILGQGIEVALDLAAPNESVISDPGELDQLLMNLVLNARDALPSGGRIRIATRLQAAQRPHNDSGSPAQDAANAAAGPRPWVVLTVADNGVGMRAHTVARIFEPFYTTKDSQGTGLGLATVKHIVERMGGTIDVTSAPGAGTEFRISMPRADADAGPQ